MAETPSDSTQHHTPFLEERIPLPDVNSMTTEQQRITESLVHGPRKGVVGPFIPLMQSPRLLNLMEPLGAELRFHGLLDKRVRELVICAVARHTSNQFEWTPHIPLAVEAGVSRSTISAVLEGVTPEGIPEDEYIALEFAQRLMDAHGVPDFLFTEAKSKFGDEGIIELTTLIGYYVTVCWIMNVARTHAQGEPDTGII
ncbi:MAG: carboxymuconolactone decarboxylase family protein [Acidimicrobiales bacterium]|jgi:4-carboxymuconolactone decarboxylase